MKTILILVTSTLLLVSCQNKTNENIATGIFEATETTVSAEQSGKLVMLNVSEGQPVVFGQEVGLVDTVPFQLKVLQAEAVRKVYDAQRPDIAVQVAATQQQLDKAQREVRRYSELVKDGAAPRKLLEDAQSQVAVIQRQLTALRSSLAIQNRTLGSQQTASDSEKALLLEQIRKCHILSPITGVVLEKYVEQGEVIAAGKPLFKVADMQNMYLRAYVTSAQLAVIQVGRKVKVTADYGNGQGKTYDGTVSWISSKSEFTPKTILTDDERADLVYAVKIAFRNDGHVKIGMYGRTILAEI